MTIAAATATTPFLLDLAVTLAVAVAIGLLLHRLHQSVMPGYLVAGLLVGPGALGLVEDVDTFSVMAEVGVALLLFTIGLELPWSKVQKFGARSLAAGVLQVALTLIIVTPLLTFIDVEWEVALVVAMAVSLSSTAIVMRMLQDRAETESVHGLAVTGLLIAQDLCVVIFLLVIPQLGEGADTEFTGPLLTSLGKLIGLVLVMWLIELLLMRRLFGRGTLAAQRELLALTALLMSAGAIGVSMELGLSPALGGFIAGVLMAESPYADQVRGDVAALRMGLVAIFFAWVGMLADVSYMADHWAHIALLSLLLIVGKAVLSALSMRALGITAMAAVIGGVAVAQLGEFSFALLTSASASGIIDSAQFQLLVSVSLVTLLLTPPLTALTSRTLHRRAAHRHVDLSSHSPATQTPGQVLVVGAGPAGRSVVQACLAAGHAVSVIELNPRLDLGAIQGPLQSTFGDAANPEVLVRAGIMTARMFVVTVPDTAAQRTIIGHARELAPGIHVVARGRYHVFVDDLATAGADEVVDEELVVGRELAVSVLARLDKQDDTEGLT